MTGSADDDQTKVLVTVSEVFSGTTNTPVRGNGAFADAFSLPVDRLYKLAPLTIR